jgi:hypothetical protein
MKLPLLASIQSNNGMMIYNSLNCLGGTSWERKKDGSVVYLMNDGTLQIKRYSPKITN